MVAEELKTDIKTETWWIHYKTKLGPACDQLYKVYNIKDLQYKVAQVSFSNYDDHSKFVVSADQSKPWICVGDINRSVS